MDRQMTPEEQVISLQIKDLLERLQATINVRPLSSPFIATSACASIAAFYARDSVPREVWIELCGKLYDQDHKDSGPEKTATNGSATHAPTKGKKLGKVAGRK